MKTTKFKPARLGFFNPTTFDSMFNSFFDGHEGVAQKQESFFAPNVDIVESEKNFELFLTLPGMEKKDITIEFKNDELMVTGERKMFNKEDNAKYHLSEIKVGKFSRKFFLPENIDKEKLTAEMTNGVLKINLPKGEKELAKTIKIK